MRRRLISWCFKFVILLALPLASLSAEVVVSCGSVGREFEVCRSGAESWARKTGNTVSVIASPAAAGERMSQLQLMLAAKSSDIDIFLIDTTWPGLLSSFFIDLREHPDLRSAAREHFEAFIRNNTVEGKLVAMPWFIDAGVLYFRKDLLEKYGEKPPLTWKELTRIAERIQRAERAEGNARLWGYVFQGRAYEGLTCNALEWINSFGGGTVVDSAGKVSVANASVTEALSLASSWVGTISPRGVLNYMEEEARGVFQTGNAVFMRNWPYAWKLANAPDSPTKGKVGMASLPRGEGRLARHASALGGWSLAVSRYSRHPREAMSLVAYLSSSEEQKRRTLLLGQNPTRPALYRDKDLLAENPMLPLLQEIFQQAVPRPSSSTGTRYNRVSAEFWDTVHAILSGESAAIPVALEQLDRKLVFLSRGGKW